MTSPVKERTDIPSWCWDIINEEQKDPDKDPGFRITIKLWDRHQDLLMEGWFMFTGQDKQVMTEPACKTGTVKDCTVHWKGNSVEANHDMHGQTPFKGEPVTVTLRGLRILS